MLLSRARLRASAVLLSLVGSFGAMALQAAPAHAALTSYQDRVISEAARHRGQPYSYGASGPTRFDCSGFTMYVFGRVGRRLPHNAASQYAAVRHIPRSSMQVGDLIFFRNSSGRIYHVAIYAGHGRMWHAPHSGLTVRLVSVYSGNYVVGRA